MQIIDHDVIVAGGGLAGLVATAAFAHQGLSVLCVDPAAPVTEEDAEGADLRTTALLQPSCDVLDRLGLWPLLDPDAMPLRVMRIVEAHSDAPDDLVSRDFDSADLGDLPFGWNLPNWLLRRTLSQAVADLPGATLRYGTGVAQVMTRTAEARVTLTDGSRHRARLLVGADGRDSSVRRALGIGARTLRYGQKALAFAVTHPIPHDNVSTEIHRSGGPFTLVPLPDRDGRPCSAVVWMERGAEAQRLAALPREAFDDAASRRSSYLFGPLSLVGGRNVWPIISRAAERLTAERTALVAEAAHVMPPIGAQGLNTSIADIRALADLAAEAPDALGGPAMLGRYARARGGDVTMRVTGIDLLNRTSMAGAPLLQGARSLGLRALHDVPAIRQILMRTGLGAAG